MVADLDLHVVFGPADHLVGHHLLFGGHFVVPPAHETLDRVDGAGGVGDGLPPGGLAHDRLLLIRERDDARRKPIPLRIGDDFDILTLHHGHHRVRGAQVDSDDLFSSRHSLLLSRTNEGFGTLRKHNIGGCKGRAATWLRPDRTVTNPLYGKMLQHRVELAEPLCAAVDRPLPACHFGMVECRRSVLTLTGPPIPLECRHPIPSNLPILHLVDA